MRPRRAARASVLLAIALATVTIMGPARARPGPPILHEPVRPDPREDLAMHVAAEGDLPAALETPNGIVAAPDLREPPGPSEATYGPGAPEESFVPDRETTRPDVSGYDDPFTPSTAPFKRLSAFDGVRADYRLYVHDERLVEVPTGAAQRADEDAFFVDLVADVDPSRGARIPSVGPGATHRSRAAPRRG